MKAIIKISLAMLLLINTLALSSQTYHFPEETELHEGTWIQWPHNNLYGPWYIDDVEQTWIEMTDALQAGENVHIIATDNSELTRITNVLTNAGVPFDNLDFYVYPNNDVWSRDNGPMFVFDENDELVLLDWGFNGWGGDVPYALCDAVPTQMATDLGIPSIDLSAMVLEGGAVEHDGNGTMMATRSSVTHSSRNPDLTETEIENYLTTYAGFTNFIWLDGVYGQEITDMHIDGFLKFAGGSDVFTMNSADLDYWGLSVADRAILYGATNVDGTPFNFIYLPLTQNNVVTTYNDNLGYKGSYVNFYIANDVVLVPTYNDPNDATAINIIQGVYPNRTVLGIDVRNLYAYGGMIHCITQQQPAAITTNLPVELLYFRAKEVDCGVELRWASAQEIDHDKYVVERSENGIDFEKIGEIKAQGNSSETQLYQFIDEKAAAKNYYRLRQISINGDEDFSAIVFVENSCYEAVDVQIFPTIATSNVHISLDTDWRGMAAIEVVNVSGQTVQKSQFQHFGGQVNHDLDTSNLPEGIYYIRLYSIDNQWNTTKKLIIQR